MSKEETHTTVTSGNNIPDLYPRVYTYAFTAVPQGGKNEHYDLSADKSKLTSLQIKPMTKDEQAIVENGLTEIEKKAGIKFRQARPGETVDIDFATFRESEKTSDVKEEIIAFVDSSTENRRVRFSDTYTSDTIKNLKLTRNKQNDFLHDLLHQLGLHRPDEVFSQEVIIVSRGNLAEAKYGDTPGWRNSPYMREAQKTRLSENSWKAKIPLNAQRKQPEVYTVSEVLKDGKSVIAFDARALQSRSQDIHLDLTLHKHRNIDGLWSLYFRNNSSPSETVLIKSIDDTVTTADFKIEFWYDDNTVYRLTTPLNGENLIAASQWSGYSRSARDKEFELIPQEPAASSLLSAIGDNTSSGSEGKNKRFAAFESPAAIDDCAAPEFISGPSANDQETYSTGSRPDMGDWPKNRSGKNGSRPGAGDSAGPEWNYGSLPEECVTSITDVIEIGCVDSWALFEAVTSFNYNVAPSAPNTGDIITVGPWYSPSPIIGRY